MRQNFRGGPVDCAKRKEDTPLCCAAMYGQAAAVKVLVEAGADVNWKGAYGRMPLPYAMKGKSGAVRGSSFCA